MAGGRSIKGLTVTIDGEQAESVSVVMDTENTISAQVVSSDDEILFISEDDDPFYVYLRGEDEMILLDDPELPTNALFFYTAERWDMEEAAGTFNTGVELGEVAQLTSLEQVVGRWHATHYNLGGYTIVLDGRDIALEIFEDGTIVYYEDDEVDSYNWTASIQDNYLIASEMGYAASYLMLYENDVLVQAGEGDDFDISVYFQRSVDE